MEEEDGLDNADVDWIGEFPFTGKDNPAKMIRTNLHNLIMVMEVHATVDLYYNVDETQKFLMILLAFKGEILKIQSILKRSY